MQLTLQASLWPTESTLLDAEGYQALVAKVRQVFLAKMHEERIDLALAEPLLRVYLPLAAWIDQQKRPDQPFVLGINGAQGSGKSTLCEFLQLILREGFGYRVAGLSIDDLYKTHAERERLGHDVHPLLVTRGVPGTHDVALGLAVIGELTDPNGREVAIPAFDKARDDRRDVSTWQRVQGPVDLVIFEGWCVGASPQSAQDLIEPLNELEQREDVDGSWRRHVNAQLAGPYAELFGRIDRLIMLRVPSMQCVYEWRSLQEEKLAAKTDASTHHRIMDSSGLKRFIMHYERLTRHMLEEMPDRADLTLYLNEHHQFTSIHIKH